MEAKKVKLDYKKIDMKVKIALKRLYLALTWEELRYGLSFDKALFALLNSDLPDLEEDIKIARKAWPDLHEALKLYKSLDAKNKDNLLRKIHKELIVPFCKDEK